MNALIPFIVPPTPPGSVPIFPTHQLCVHAGVLPGLNFHVHGMYGIHTCMAYMYGMYGMNIHAVTDVRSSYVQPSCVQKPVKMASLQSSIASGPCPLSTYSSSTNPESHEESQQLLSRDIITTSWPTSLPLEAHQIPACSPPRTHRPSHTVMRPRQATHTPFPSTIWLCYPKAP